MLIAVEAFEDLDGALAVAEGEVALAAFPEAFAGGSLEVVEGDADGVLVGEKAGEFEEAAIGEAFEEEAGGLEPGEEQGVVEEGGGEILAAAGAEQGEELKASAVLEGLADPEGSGVSEAIVIQGEVNPQGRAIESSNGLPVVEEVGAVAVEGLEAGAEEAGPFQEWPARLAGSGAS
ncbi:hypothetical protein [Thermogemmatispora sp.]|uniref:hypothetical protein n=1 Tax=Thermogemmatispora sp. TaxID=1968838 RepID=UPI002ACBF896|nr:hypothetical protein [Thermogemmatispora sp.]